MLLTIEQLTRHDVDKERFWSHIKRTDDHDACWLWDFTTDSDGYGMLKVLVDGQRRMQKAHRLAYIFRHNKLPAPPLLVRHLCESRYPPGDITYRRCCNPAHLKEGTVKDNSDDMVAAGRSAKGELHSSRTHPERLARGERNGSRTHPERRPRGDSTGLRKHPEKAVRGDRHWARLYPEKIVRGEKHYKAKLTPTIKETILLLWRDGLTISEIARRIKLGRTTVKRVLDGNTFLDYGKIK